MKRSYLIVLLSTLGLLCFAQKEDTLYVDYFLNDPYAYVENEVEKGIEIEIMNEYVAWLGEKKNMDLTVKYHKFSAFDQFYASIKKGSKNSLGLGSATITKERAKEIDFSTPYLKNVAFCVTNGNATEVKTKTSDDVMRSLGSMSALTMAGTPLEKYVNDIKKQYVPDMKLLLYSNEQQILEGISKNVLYFGYVDAINFWFYLKKNPRKVLKVQKALNQSTETLGLVMPKGSQHKALFNEFFAGFSKSPRYTEILMKYVGGYMAQNVAIN